MVTKALKHWLSIEAGIAPVAMACCNCAVVTPATPPHLPQRKDHLDPAGGPSRDGGEHRGQHHFRQHAEALGGDLRQYAARRPRGAV